MKKTDQINETKVPEGKKLSVKSVLLASCFCVSLLSLGYTYFSSSYLSSSIDKLSNSPVTNQQEEKATLPESPSVIFKYSVGVSGYNSDSPNLEDFGSGTVIGSYIDKYGQYQSIILTCNHVIESQKVFHVSYGDTTVSAILLAANKDLDLALLAAPIKAPRPRIYLGNIPPGVKEILAGMPYHITMSLSAGFVGPYQKAKDTDSMRRRFGSSTIYPGDSGGGVFTLENSKWRLIGVAEEGPVRPIPSLGVPQMISTVSLFIAAPDIDTFLRSESKNIENKLCSENICDFQLGNLYAD